jgi:pimeloyl-ACP methyl ester carboxylesterase
VAAVAESGRGRAPPTAVLVHGILGSRRNLAGFAARLVEGFPAWQVLLVDLRCHGESAAAAAPGAYGHDGGAGPPPPAHPAPHTVASSAADILALLASLKLFPEVLVGHSFGGKVVMSMAAQFGGGGVALPRPVHVWVLDALPGAVRGDGPDAADHPARLVDTLRSLPLPLPSRSDLAARLTAAGFSTGVARWAATNLRPAVGADQTALVWGFDLAGIRDMYDSYESDSMWPFLQAPPPGVEVNFVRAARSEYRWGGGDADAIVALGHGVHDLPGAGHWVHAENPDGLFDILAPSFGGGVDLHVRRSTPGSPGLV